jgi:hypothetical protein
VQRQEVGLAPPVEPPDRDRARHEWNLLRGSGGHLDAAAGDC